MKSLLENTRVNNFTILCFLLVVASPVSAQSERIRCPGLVPAASAEEHVICWYENHERGSAGCKAEKRGADTCVLQTLNWCAESTFDAAPVVNACFLANIRAGQFDEALSVAEYLQAPSGEVQKCRDALSSITVRIVSIPRGAEVWVDGRLYGQAPVEVKITGNWRQSQVVAQFGSGDKATRIEATKQELINTFDTQACIMGDLVLKGPNAKVSTTMPNKQSITDKPLLTEHAEEDAGISIPGIVFVGLGAAGIVAGSILFALAETRISDLKDANLGTRWTNEMQDDYDSLTPLRIGGGVALGCGVVMGVIGTILLLNNSSPPSEAEVSGHRIKLTDNRATMEWEF